MLLEHGKERKSQLKCAYYVMTVKLYDIQISNSRSIMDNWSAAQIAAAKQTIIASCCHFKLDEVLFELNF